MKEKLSDIFDFNEWTEISKGYYKHKVSSNLSYEIQINLFVAETLPSTVNATLYLVKNFLKEPDLINELKYLSRDFLYTGTLLECIRRITLATEEKEKEDI